MRHPGKGIRQQNKTVTWIFSQTTYGVIDFGKHITMSASLWIAGRRAYVGMVSGLSGALSKSQLPLNEQTTGNTAHRS